MKKNIYVIRSARYDYSLPNMDLYDSFNLVATGEVEVESSEVDTSLPQRLPSILSCQVGYSSPRVRSVQTAKAFAPKVSVISELAEVGYTMPELISKADFYGKDGAPQVTVARRAFVRKLIANELSESYKSVMSRISNVLTILDADSAQRIIVCSHGFMMKIIEAYIKNPRIASDPQLLLNYFDGEHETFHFLEGFEVQKSDSFEFVQYIFPTKVSG